MAGLVDTRMPGVYTREIPTLPPSVALVPTAVPVFIGFTEKAVKDGEDVNGKPVRIKSMVNYTDWFGTAPNETISVTVDDRSKLDRPIDVTIDKTVDKNFKRRMYYALKLYFLNGGGPAYIISIGTYVPKPPVTPAPPPLGGGATPPSDKDLLISGIDAAKKAKEITILVLPDAVSLSDGEYKDVIKAALAHCQKMVNRVVVLDVKDKDDTGKPVDEISEVTTHFRNQVPSEIEQKKYGAAYYPFLKTTLSYQYQAADVKLKVNTYAKKPAPSTPAPPAPGAPAPAPPAPGAPLATTSTDDPTDSTAEFTTADEQKMGAIFATNDLLYNLVADAIRLYPVPMPPSAAVAGVYVTTDFSQGVWKAPANVSLAGVVGTTVEIDDDFHADLNVDATGGFSVNAIRPYTGRGILIFGARTLAGNNLEWRYVSVRRTFCFIEDAVGQAMQDFVFAPNTRDTWIKVKAMIGNFLNDIWGAGGLFGNTPDEAYRVSVGEPETMSDIDILEGRMIVEMKLRVARPAEFIILRYEHKFQTNNN